MGISYSQPNRAERLIAAGRMVLAAFALFAIWLDPTDPAKYVVPAYFLLAGYLCYSFALAVTVWRTDLTWTHSAVVIHAFDLLIFAVFMFVTSGPASPFFAFFTFSLAAATLRWQWRGIIWTVAFALGIEIAIVIYSADLTRGPDFKINLVIFRVGYFLVVATLLGYLGAYEKQHRGKISGLAEWPRTVPEEVDLLVREILQHSSLLFAAHRAILLWKDDENPLLHTASWSSGQFHHSLESPDTLGTLVADPLAGRNFLCRDSLAPKPWVLHSAPTGFERWQGMPLHPELQRRFSIKSVLSLALQSESVWGCLFILDKADISSDDLVLGNIVAHEASCSLDQFYLLKRLRQTAAVEERIRLARDLHDGLLQSLTSVGLQLDTVHQLMGREPQTARQRLLDIQKLVSTEQQNLRSHIKQLKPPYSSLPEWDADLPRRLKELAEHIERQWGLPVDIDVNLHLSRLPWTMAQGVYFIIQEAIINAARHAKASSIQAEINSTDHQLQIIVTDNGQGFPFDGRLDHTILTETKRGPAILQERVTSLGGRLVIDSGKAGARLEITLPIPEKMS